MLGGSGSRLYVMVMETDRPETGNQ